MTIDIRSMNYNIVTFIKLLSVLCGRSMAVLLTASYGPETGMDILDPEPDPLRKIQFFVTLNSYQDTDPLRSALLWLSGSGSGFAFEWLIRIRIHMKPRRIHNSDCKMKHKRECFTMIYDTKPLD